MQGCSIVHMTQRDHLAVKKWGGLRAPQIYVIEYPKELEYYNIRSQISLFTDFASSRVLVPEAEGGTLSK